MLGHISYGVGDLARTTEFYDACMGALGYERVFTGPRYVGYGLPGARNERLLLFLKPGPVIPTGTRLSSGFRRPEP